MAPGESVQVKQGSRAPERLHKKFGPYFRSNRESLRGSKPDTDIIISALFQGHSSVRRRKERREEKRKAGIAAEMRVVWAKVVVMAKGTGRS